MKTVNIRFIVTDVDAAIEFYTNHLGFEVLMHPAPGFAALKKGVLTLYLNAPGAGGAGQDISDGSTPQPGGWNRIQFQVDNLESIVDGLKKQGLYFRSEIISGNGGKQILLEDPAGNPIELFEPHDT